MNKHTIIWYADDEPTGLPGYVPQIQCREERDNEGSILDFVQCLLKAGKRFIVIAELPQ